MVKVISDAAECHASATGSQTAQIIPAQKNFSAACRTMIHVGIVQSNFASQGETRD
jgi:hypothetical protein